MKETSSLFREVMPTSLYGADQSSFVVGPLSVIRNSSAGRAGKIKASRSARNVSKEPEFACSNKRHRIARAASIVRSGEGPAPKGPTISSELSISTTQITRHHNVKRASPSKYKVNTGSRKAVPRAPSCHSSWLEALANYCDWMGLEHSIVQSTLSIAR